MDDVAASRRTFFARARAVVAALLVLLSTAWQVLAGTQVVRNVGDFARFGSIVFQVLAPLVLTAGVSLPPCRRPPASLTKKIARRSICCF